MKGKVFFLSVCGAGPCSAAPLKALLIICAENPHLLINF